MSTPDILHRCRLLARAAALVAIAAGGAALLGWVLEADLLKSVVPGQVTMKVNTALCLLAAGVALWALVEPVSRVRAAVGRGMALAVVLLAGAVLSQYLTGHDLGIDQALFVEAPGATATVDPNRMAPNTALAFVLIGGALLLLDACVPGAQRVAPVLAGMSAALALVALTGYISGLTSFYGVEGFTQMAVPTTLAFLALALGVVLARPERPPMRELVRDTPGGSALRRLVPAVVIGPVALGALRLAGQQAGLYSTVVGAWLLVLAMIALALLLVWRLTAGLDRADAHRRRAEELRESEERARRILDTAYDAFVATDGGGRITAWNAASERLFGLSATEALGRSAQRLIVPPRLRVVHQGLLTETAAALAAGRPAAHRSVETTALHRDGHEIPVELQIAAVAEPSGPVINAFLRDVTDRRRAHDELRAAHDELRAAHDELAAAQHEVLHRLAVAAEYRDDDTGEHTRRVGELSARLAERLGLPPEQVELVRRAAPLHDVGKIGIPDSILLKPGRLDEAEFEQVKGHALIGAQILAGRGFPLLEAAEQIALTHHERWDGTGYPHGLAGEAIPLVGRIVAITDVFDALTHDRPYKRAWSVPDALAEIRDQCGRQFEPALVAAFVDLVAPGHGTARWDEARLAA